MAGCTKRSSGDGVVFAARLQERKERRGAGVPTRSNERTTSGTGKQDHVEGLRLASEDSAALEAVFLAAGGDTRAPLMHLDFAGAEAAAPEIELHVRMVGQQ